MTHGYDSRLVQLTGPTNFHSFLALCFFCSHLFPSLLFQAMFLFRFRPLLALINRVRAGLGIAVRAVQRV